jgi:drug/metabolite transporter (DMT)-like permease
MHIDKRYVVHGFLPAFFSACFFAVMVTCIKAASSELPAIQLVFLRSFVGLIIIIPFILPRGISFMKTSVFHIHIFRGLISISAMTCLYFAIANIGLSEATLLNAASPLFIALLAAPILNERINTRIFLILIIGFIGVLLILKPGTSMFTFAAIIGLCSGFFIACAKILIRYMARTEPVIRTVFYFSIFSTFYSGIAMFWFWQTPTIFDLSIMILAGVCATGGQTLLTYAFTNNEVSTVSPFTYVTVLMATLFGWIGWNEVPDIGSGIGAIFIIGSCLSLTLQGKLPTAWKMK